MISKAETRVLVAEGHQPSKMTDAEQQAELARINGEALSSITPTAPLPAPATAPDDFDQLFPATGDAVDYDALMAAFLTGGQKAFQANTEAVISAIKLDHADQLAASIAALQAEQAKAEAAVKASRSNDRLIIRSESSPDITATDLDYFPVSDLIDNIDAEYQFAATDDRAPSGYDFRHVDQTGLLKILSVAWSTQSNVWLWGERSTGKTTLIQALAKVLGRPFKRISHFKGMEVQALLGNTVIDQDGKFVWQDGLLTAAIRTANTVILIDEPSRSPEACELYQTLLDERVLTLESGEVIPVARDVQFVAADNTRGQGDETGRYAGTDIVSSAMLDRFSFMEKMDFMAESIEADILAKLIDVETADLLAEFAARLRTAVADGDIEEPISHRRMVALTILLANGVALNRALESAVYQHVTHEADAEFYRTMAQAHLNLGGAV